LPREQVLMMAIIVGTVLLWVTEALPPLRYRLHSDLMALEVCARHRQ
jgi:hypothetical protein